MSLVFSVSNTPLLILVTPDWLQLEESVRGVFGHVTFKRLFCWIFCCFLFSSLIWKFATWSISEAIKLECEEFLFIVLLHFAFTEHDLKKPNDLKLRISTVPNVPIVPDHYFTHWTHKLHFHSAAWGNGVLEPATPLELHPSSPLRTPPGLHRIYLWFQAATH